MEGNVAMSSSGFPEPAAAFLALLDEELQAARTADVDALSEIQERKRAALPALLSADLPEDARTALQERAQANVRLIRQLVQGLSNMLSAAADDTYDAYGKRNSLGPSSLRVTL